MKNRRVFELRLGKVGLILFIGGMSLLMFSIFLLGVIIGKQMEAYPERYSAGIPELIRENVVAALSKQAKGSSATVTPEGKENEASGSAEFGLTFYDTLGGKKGGGAAVAPASPSRQKTPGDPSLPATPGAAKQQTGPPVSGHDSGSKKMNAPQETIHGNETGMQSPPAGGTGTQGKGGFEVQLAAYRERSQAEQLVNRLSGSGFSPRVVLKDLPEKGRWFRVIVGGFASRQAAQEAADQMSGKVRGLKCVIRSSAKEDTGG